MTHETDGIPTFVIHPRSAEPDDVDEQPPAGPPSPLPPVDVQDPATPDYRPELMAANLRAACERIRGTTAPRALARIGEALDRYREATEEHLGRCRYARAQLLPGALEDHLEAALAEPFERLALAIADEIGQTETQRLLGILMPRPAPEPEPAAPAARPSWLARVGRALRGTAR